MAMLRAVVLVLLCWLQPPSTAALQLGLVSPERLSQAVLMEASNQTAHSQCRQDFARWMSGLSSGQRWAAEMADSWTKSFTGLLHGNTYDLGDFDECIYASSESEISASAPVIRGAYLLPFVSISSIKEGAPPGSGSVAQALSEVVPVSLRVSFCVPDSCDDQLLVTALNQVARDLLSEAALGGSFTASVTLREGKQSLATQLRPGAPHWIYMSVWVLLALLAVVATILDNKLDMTDSKEARQRWRYLLHFSLRSGMQRLMAPAPAGSMSCINGIRVMSALWIVIGHTMDYFPAVMNAWDFEQFKKAHVLCFLMGFPFAVDTFLIVGGLVCCISFLRAANKQNGFNWLKYIVRRYARTTPALAMAALYGATWFGITSPGVNSSSLGMTAFKQWYQNYWWTSIAHISNLMGDVSMLIPHIWYLSLDMQLYVAAPIVLIPLWKRPLFGKALLAVVTFAACLLPGALSVVYKSKTNHGTDIAGESSYFYVKIFYFGTESRIPPYLVGIAAGYFLYQYKYGTQKFRLNKLQAVAMWLLSAALALVTLYAPHSIDTGGPSHPYNAVESFFYLGFTRMAWAASIALVIIACETGWGGPVNKILSIGVFAPLGKLCFTVYLVHYFVAVIDMLYVVHGTEYFSTYVLIRHVLSSATLTLPLAAALHLLVEQPFMLLENELWK